MENDILSWPNKDDKNSLPSKDFTRIVAKGPADSRTETVDDGGRATLGSESDISGGIILMRSSVFIKLGSL